MPSPTVLFGPLRVSIVIDSYNYERYLGEAIESALRQTHPDVEVIVVDDGSTDGSRDVIAAFDGRVETVLQENRGQAGALNSGFAATSGDVIQFVDCDDVLLPGAAAAAAAAAEDGVSQIHWQLLDIDADGVQSGATSPPDQPADGDVLEQLKSLGPLTWPSPPMSGNAWPRRYLEQVMPMPEEEFRLCADAYLMGLAPLYGRLRAVEPPQGCYRLHGANPSSRSREEVVRENREVIRKLMPITAEHAARRGLAVDPELWAQDNYDLKMPDFFDDLDAVVGRSTPFILIDGQELALDVSDRPAIPFLERDGVYWGEPADDDQAIAELARMRADGTRFLVLAWPSFWWTEHYAGFIEHVRRSYRCRLENDRVVIFEL